jgi:fructose-1,6-bisphosphatase
MTQHDFSDLLDHYSEIIDQMENVFTSHQFILALAQRYQGFYVEALYAYRDSVHRGRPAPFRAVHGILAQYLNDYSHLVTRDPPDEDVASENIFGRPDTCAQWHKL